MSVLKVDNLSLPLTNNKAEFNNSYVCSPYGQYIEYGIEELSHLAPPWLKSPLAIILKGAGKFLKRNEINKVVMVNNWLFSTNLYPDISREQVLTLISSLQKEYPDHAIVFKSINQVTTPSFFEPLPLRLIPSRPVYIFNPKLPRAFKSRMVQSDQKLLKQTSYRRVALKKEDAPRIAELYRMLNIEKYAKINPQFNAKFIEMALQTSLLEFIAFEKEGEIDAVCGFFCQNGVMTSPFFGYDTTKPKELGLYRLISIALMLEAEERACLLHMSAGAGSFKRLRRAEKHMEYNALSISHLSKKRQRPWKAIDFVMNKIGIPILNHFEL
ncbi:MAG: hypothetical protein WDZ27_02555 [Waddliaceae bacterium]